MGSKLASTDTNAVVIPQAESRGVGLPAGYACVRSLGKRGVHTIVASIDGAVPETTSRYCDESVIVPPPTDDLIAYKDALLAIAARSDVRTVIPVIEEDIYVLSQYREEFEQYVSLAVPSPEVLRGAHDRVRLVEAARKAGVPAPDTWPLDEVSDWDRELLIKSRYNLLVNEYVPSITPGQCHTVKSQTHLSPDDRPNFETVRDEMKHTPIVQEFVPRAGEYMFTALYDHGEPLSTFQHHQIRGNSYTGGGGVYRESVYIDELETVARRLLDELDWHGLACIEYIEDANTGEFKVVEINPRMWQSSLATARMGADFAAQYWQLAGGNADKIEPGYDLGVGCHYLKGELSYFASLFRDESTLVSRPPIGKTVVEMASSFLRHPRFDYLRFDDPLPFAHDIVRNVRSRRDEPDQAATQPLPPTEREPTDHPPTPSTPDRGRPIDIDPRTD
jgi:predicted ATP-grasp superfamily ATP-dependent carboligase